MLLGARQTMWKKNGKFPIYMDPTKCKSYIRRQNESDTCYIRVQNLQITSPGPFFAQIIIKPLAAISNDKKFLKMDFLPLQEYSDSSWGGFDIIDGIWRCYFKDTNNTWYGDRGIVRIPVTTDKTDIRVDPINFNTWFNGQPVNEINVGSAPKNVQYMWCPYQHGDVNYFQYPSSLYINYIDVFGLQNHDWGQLHANVYRIAIFTYDMKPVCILMPGVVNGEAGFIDQVTNQFYGKTGLNGNFIYGEDI